MIRTTASQDKHFLSEMIPFNLLEQAIQYVADNFNPEDVFEIKRLEGWAEENDYIKNQE